MKTTTSATLPASKPALVPSAEAAAPSASPIAPTRDYFTGQVHALEKNLAQAQAAEESAKRHRMQLEGGLNLARGQLALFFPTPPPPPPAATETPAVPAAA